MNVEIGTEAMQLPEKEYINRIILAVWISRSLFPFPQGEAFTMLARQRFAAPKGVGPGPTLAWPGWKQPDISVEVDTGRLETSSSEAGVLKKLSLAGIDKLSRLKYE
jgi:hypothetical protein